MALISKLQNNFLEKRVQKNKKLDTYSQKMEKDWWGWDDTVVVQKNIPEFISKFCFLSDCWPAGMQIPKKLFDVVTAGRCK